MELTPFKWWPSFTFDDYFVFAYIFFLIILFTSDLVFRLGERINKSIKIQLSPENTVFYIGLISHLSFFLFNILFHDSIGAFLGIVDFDDVRYQIMRWRIVRALTIFVFSGVAISPVLCGLLAHRMRKGVWKWCALGIFFGYLTVVKLLFLKTDSEIA